MNPAIRLWVMSAAFAASCSLVRCKPAELPIQDAGDGSAGSFCQRDCARRFAIGCLEAGNAAFCESTCDRAVDAGVFTLCTSCVPYASPDGSPHIHCNGQ
jgi:hypothetical protein